jgi:hypothetical protein
MPRPSLVARRDFIGDEGMASLWYLEGFVDRQAELIGCPGEEGATDR